MSAGPNVQLVYVIFAPLADQSGQFSSAGLLVRFVLPEPSVFMT